MNLSDPLNDRLRDPLLREPLPCPFCGDAPEVQVGEDHGGWATIECVADSCLVNPRTVASEALDGYGLRTSAIIRWNKRPGPRSTSPEPAPIPMLLWCPACGERHIDAGAFATSLHTTHACQHCGMVWRPAVVPTVGVLFLPGYKDP